MPEPHPDATAPDDAAEPAPDDAGGNSELTFPDLPRLEFGCRAWVAERIEHLPVGKGLLGALIEHPAPIRITGITRRPPLLRPSLITSFLCEQDARRPAWAARRPSEDDL